MNKAGHIVAWATLTLLLAPGLPGCGKSDEPPPAKGPAPAALTVWAHAGQETERATLQAQVARFQEARPDLALRLSFLPERTYNAQIQAAALAGELPDVLELDGPYVANYAWQGHIAPLDGLLPATLVADLLPSLQAQGRYAGRLYAVGVFDSGLGLYGRRSALEEAGLRLPAGAEEAWSAAEFDAVLAALAARDTDGAVLDLKLNYGGEWYTYAFSPLLVSAGADLIDRRDYRHARGVLDSPAAVATLRRVQGWLNGAYVDPNVDDAAFTSGRVALSWAGHWEYRRYREAAGADLVVLPLPDFGHGSRTGQGSWAWAVRRDSARAREAAAFLQFLLRPEEVLAMTAANSAVPGTRTALSRSPRYGEGGPLRLFARQLLAGQAVPRPPTPAYPAITSAFQQAFVDIRNGADAAAALGRAAALIDRDIADNRGYPPP
ncbi:MAG TPA: sugar ABC transporter substrate-binding protein [Gammaproteobacteria bacterium]|nr:sugar ABC transporter substrate-binding protein [Gammaproteobacteria bacterium]